MVVGYTEKLIKANVAFLSKYKVVISILVVFFFF